MDDLYIIAWNPLVHSLHGAWRAFGGPYWPPDLGGQMYRPLPLATFAVDWSVAGGHPALFHAMNLLWHTGAALAVTALARRLGDWTAALVAGVIFAVHSVHGEGGADVIRLRGLHAGLGGLLSGSAPRGRERRILWGGSR